MKFSKFTAERDNQRAEILFMRIAVGGLVLALLANAGASLSVAGSERTILVPPEVHKTFWVSKELLPTIEIGGRRYVCIADIAEFIDRRRPQVRPSVAPLPPALSDSPARRVGRPKKSELSKRRLNQGQNGDS